MEQDVCNGVLKISFDNAIINTGKPELHLTAVRAFLSLSYDWTAQKTDAKLLSLLLLHH